VTVRGTQQKIQMLWHLLFAHPEITTDLLHSSFNIFSLKLEPWLLKTNDKQKESAHKY
jgi:hypothetical protein